MRYDRALDVVENTLVLALVRAFLDIAVHRRGPEDLPASSFLLGLALIAYLTTSYVALQLAPPLEYAALLLALDTVVYCAFIWGVLKVFTHESRFTQTATALFGVEALLTVLRLPLLLWTRALEAANAEATVPSILLLLLLIWTIDVAAHVLSRAIGRPYVLGISIMLGYVLLQISVRASLFPPAAS